MRSSGVVLLCAAACLAACDSARTPGGGGNTPRRDASVTSSTADASAGDATGGADASDAGTTTPDAGAGALRGIELMQKLAGLWSGPVTDTRLGNFPLTNMDFRAASDSVLFGRVDLDAENSLRFAFAGEVQSGARVLVFRNGGLFRGLSRDTRTALMESTASTYRFCAIDGGCAYVDATFTFSSETQMTLRVLVRGMLHEVWNATRVETRTLPAGFPARTDLPGNADFPPMPTGSIRVRWTTPAATPTDVWVILSTTSCIPSGGCQFSRWIKGVAAANATDVTIRIDQLHAGSYAVLGVVDANGDLAATRFPGSGDLITVPSPTLTAAGTDTATADATATYRLP